MDLIVAGGRRLRLRQLPVEPAPLPPSGRMALRVARTEHRARFSELLTRAGQAQFEMRSMPAVRPAAFQDPSGLLRVVYKEIVIRLRSRVPSRRRDRILARHGFRIRTRNRQVRNEYVVFHPEAKIAAADLIAVSNDWNEMDEVAFATPNFVSEYRREQLPAIHPEQWHLRNRGSGPGQLAGEDVDVLGAWAVTTGDPGVRVAVLDDGVDVDHPELAGRIARDPDPETPADRFGRDFFVPADHPEHFDPRPKQFTFPFDLLAGNDIHGTPCAGVIAADGSRGDVIGVAPRCRLLAVKIFHADFLASDHAVGQAIRYAARHADILSCSWTGPYSDDVAFAIRDAGNARGGRGAAVFCAAGNGFGAPVGHPASLPEAIAVAASTDQGRPAGYSNAGPELSICAPSSGGVRAILCTDVSLPNRGFNLGDAAAGGVDGLHTNSFGGTSSATPLAAGVAALMLSVRPDLSRESVRELLESTADKIGTGYVGGHSPRFGHGRIDAAAAVAAARDLP